MISAAKRRLLRAQMHLKVLEKVNVLQKQKKKQDGADETEASDFSVIIIFRISLKPYALKSRG